MMPVYPQESRLEKFIRDFVYHNTAEAVDLQLKDDIIIKHVKKKGSIVLGIFWSNVLQSDRNFPPFPYSYKKAYDENLKEEKLMVTVDGITFTVYLTTGTFTINGQYIYEWFTTKFKGLLSNFDAQFGEEWRYEATPVVRTRPHRNDRNEIQDIDTETEKYLSFRNTEHQDYEAIDRKLEEGSEDLITGIGNLNIDHQLYSSGDLEMQVSSLRTGSVQDGLAVVYKVWKSLLNKWFAAHDTQVYISTPMLDATRLRDILELYLNHRILGQIKAFYINQNTDPIKQHSANDVKKAAIANMDDKVKTFLQYRVLRKMVHPIKETHANFIAGVCKGKAEVLLTSAAFHGSCFVSGSTEMVMFVSMSEEEFLKNYIAILESPNVATTY